jgi:osmotically-inducible protein OsmY/sporulation protein YlmC with PRC-barrel domain
MKRKIQIIMSASAASVLALSALAQDTIIPRANGTNYSLDGMSPARRAGRLNDAAKASDVIGMTVNNKQDEKLGKVSDLGVDVESGRIVQVILSTGGFLGMGETLTAVPPEALHRDVALKVLHLDADKEKLKAAPKFEMSNWAENSDCKHLSAVYRLYGQEPALTFIQKRDAVLDGQSTTNASPTTVSTRKADGTWAKNSSSGKSKCSIPESRLSQVQKASKLMGTQVNNLQDEKLGKVENILVDLPSGRLVAVIVSSGGFLGMGDELSAVPPTALRFTTDRDTLQLDASKEMLSNAPHFKANQWPDFAQTSYAGGVYSAYQVEPYFTTNATTEADNTARNVRDRDSSTLTPLDQGNSKADLNTTAQIRKEILDGKNMSVNARNVKIITVDGHVTLRGPVNNAEEKRLIGEIADRIAHSENVDNQLEVKFTTSSND